MCAYDSANVYIYITANVFVRSAFRRGVELHRAIIVRGISYLAAIRATRGCKIISKKGSLKAAN